jgi:beta-phosphoglucomutase
MAHHGVIWDMDGVLVDTHEFHYRAWSQTLADYGVQVSRKDFQPLFGLRSADIMTALLGRPPDPEMLEEVDERKEALFRGAVPGNVQTLPGVRDWLQRLDRYGVRQAVASSAPPANIEVIVDELELQPYFDVLVSGFQLPGKPDPTLYLTAAERLDVPPHHCVVVEDAVQGVEGAKAAGMKCLAVATAQTPERLQAADAVVERLDQLPITLFEQLLGEKLD